MDQDLLIGLKNKLIERELLLGNDAMNTISCCEDPLVIQLLPKHEDWPVEHLENRTAFIDHHIEK